MTTLAELTLKLSNDLSALESRCRRALADAEQARDRALFAGPGQKALQRYYDALEKARRARVEAEETAHAIRERKVDEAEERRREALYALEEKYRDARMEAEQNKRGAESKARIVWEKAMKKAERAPLLNRARLRREADEALEQALQEAREACELAIEDARLSNRGAIDDELVEERLAIGRAEREAERQLKSAAVSYERAVAAEEIRLRRELSGDPGAARTMEAYDSQVIELRDGCDAERQELFRRFNEARKALEPSRSARKK